MMNNKIKKELTFIEQTRKLIDENKFQEAVKSMFDYSYDNDILAQEFTDYFILGYDLKDVMKNEDSVKLTDSMSTFEDVKENEFYKWKTFVGGDIEIKNLTIDDVEECFNLY